jgi:hypothetical protein
MWRDVFLHNKDAVLEMLARLNEDIALLARAIRWGEGDKLTRSSPAPGASAARSSRSARRRRSPISAAGASRRHPGPRSPRPVDDAPEPGRSEEKAGSRG